MDRLNPPYTLTAQPNPPLPPSNKPHYRDEDVSFGQLTPANTNTGHNNDSTVVDTSSNITKQTVVTEKTSDEHDHHDSNNTKTH